MYFFLYSEMVGKGNKTFRSTIIKKLMNISKTGTEQFYYSPTRVG